MIDTNCIFLFCVSNS